MNQALSKLAWVLALLALLAALLFQRNANHRLTAELQATQQSIQDSHRALETTGNLSKQLEEKVSRLTEVLNQSTEKLAEAGGQLKEYEARFGPVSGLPRKPLAPDEAKRLMAQIPPPLAEERKDPAGKVTRRVVFPQLTGRENQVLATNAEFGSLSGRRLVFRRASGPPLAFDVDEVHPAVLAWLEIDPDAAKYQQAQLDQQKQAREAAAYKDYLARQAAEQKAAQIARAAQAQAQAASQKQQAELELKYRELENDRLRAEAQLRSADAAMARALYSAPGYYGYPSTVVPVYPWHPGTPPSAPTPPTGGGAGGSTGTGQKGNFLPSAPMLPAQPMLPRTQEPRTPSSR